MSFSLYLLRHGQSADKQLGQSDYDRRLTGQGIEDIKNLGNYLKLHHQQIDFIVSSPSARTKDTCELLLPYLNISKNQITYNEVLYNGNPEEYTSVLLSFESHKNGLLIGHNPSVSLLAQALSEELIGSLAPGALVKIKFAGTSWIDLFSAKGVLDFQVDPLMLTKQ